MKEALPQTRTQALKLTLQTLEQSLRAGFSDRQKIRTDPVFKEMREMTEFRKLLQ